MNPEYASDSNRWRAGSGDSATYFDATFRGNNSGRAEGPAAFAHNTTLLGSKTLGSPRDVKCINDGFTSLSLWESRASARRGRPRRRKHQKNLPSLRLDPP
ncbi:hypothetical protein UC8_15480 [Roseimaritima ulvae]|uniref:Uncharacterized protein n=1 Tax=Roseimaritima ulvae TaxID=980254 RepID=A0A5B9QZW8_9BACT|nr:hypothetical protein UC8_15480 [Roseimaritima ulvae]